MKKKVPYGFVYETVNKVNKMKYIGKCIYSRENNWETYLGSGLYLKRAIKSHGRENFERTILKEAYSYEELNALEELFLAKYEAAASEEYYNLKSTSIGGDTFTTNPRKEEIRQLKRLRMEGSNNHQFGKEKTDKMIASVKKANSRPIVIEGIKYESQIEACEVLGIKHTTLGYRLDSDNWEEWKRSVPKNNTTRTTVPNTIKVEIDGVIYDSINHAIEALPLSRGTVFSRLNSEKFPKYKRLS